MSTPTPSTRTRATNVLVIGSGGAGLRAAIAATRAGADVVIIGKRDRQDAHTVLAAGGINAALGTRDPEDSWQQHFADTMRDGYGLADRRMVEILATEAPTAVLELADWGCGFARTADGRLDQRFFGAHTYRRTCYAGDYTGRAIVRTLGSVVTELGITFVPGQYVSRLLIADGSCFGVFAFDLATGEHTTFLADAVVLATGGHTRIWRRSSSRRDENYGEGMALALRAGCRLSDMELVQFHPTGMVQPEDVAGTLVTEAVRGEGGRLVNALGERYMERYDPQRRELSTRDRVALANYTEIAEGRGGPNGGVFLDVSHLEKSVILEKLPRMYRQFIEYQMLDISKHPMEVAPTAHYSMGGVVVDPKTTATDLDGLFAAGEVTAGLHGANRLGGNSLAETLVFGRRAGEQAAARSAATDVMLRPRAVIEDAASELDALVRQGDQLARPLQRAVRDLMWETCGVVRDEERLRQGLDGIRDLAAAADDVDVSPTEEGWGDLGHLLDLRSALATGEATLLSGLARTESRGAHNRADFPALDDAQLVNHRVRRDPASGELSLTTDPVPPTSEELSAWLEHPVVEVDGDRLLE
ncbi:MAG: FAD-dependent oxidoreductase [Actinomycetota bacterium]|nr:FAD-dependent oxidoreductase [Actinomycetota bacterium]